MFRKEALESTESCSSGLTYADLRRQYNYNNAAAEVQTPAVDMVSHQVKLHQCKLWFTQVNQIYAKGMHWCSYMTVAKPWCDLGQVYIRRALLV